MNTDVHIHQIVWNDAQRATLEPGYRVLDNTANPRPDWFEYWPIRQFWLSPQSEWSQPLAKGELDQAYFGFFSPKFAAKTLLTHADVMRHMDAAMAQQAEVVAFSPQPDMAAAFLNVFEQQEVFDPGFMALSQAFFSELGEVHPLGALVMDSQTTVFSNYFVARGSFWRRWLAVNERLFAMAEDVSHPLHARLTKSTTYVGAAQSKVFLMERVASWLLSTLDPEPVVHAANPWGMAWSASRLRELHLEMVMLDAVKQAMRRHGWPQYTSAFAKLRQMLHEHLNQTAPVSEVSGFLCEEAGNLHALS
jgi:hypothetical protein